MNKETKAKPKPKTKPDNDQAARFIETARLLEVDESGEEFNRAISAIIQPKDFSKR